MGIISNTKSLIFREATLFPVAIKRITSRENRLIWKGNDLEEINRYGWLFIPENLFSRTLKKSHNASEEEIGSAKKLVRILGSWGSKYLSRQLKLKETQIDLGRIVEVIESNELKIENYQDLIQTRLIIQGSKEFDYRIKGSQARIADFLFYPDTNAFHILGPTDYTLDTYRGGFHDPKSNFYNLYLVLGTISEFTSMPYGEIILTIKQFPKVSDSDTFLKLHEFAIKFVEKVSQLNLYKNLRLFKIKEGINNPVEFKFEQPINLKRFLESKYPKALYNEKV